ncbi:hypothetical protein PCE1_000280 [Barthelona sp. PCE]
MSSGTNVLEDFFLPEKVFSNSSMSSTNFSFIFNGSTGITLPKKLRYGSIDLKHKPFRTHFQFPVKSRAMYMNNSTIFPNDDGKSVLQMNDGQYASLPFRIENFDSVFGSYRYFQAKYGLYHIDHIGYVKVPPKITLISQFFFNFDDYPRFLSFDRNECTGNMFFFYKDRFEIIHEDELCRNESRNVVLHDNFELGFFDGFNYCTSLLGLSREHSGTIMLYDERICAKKSRPIEICLEPLTNVKTLSASRIVSLTNTHIKVYDIRNTTVPLHSIRLKYAPLANSLVFDETKKAFLFLSESYDSASIGRVDSTVLTLKSDIIPFKLNTDRNCVSLSTNSVHLYSNNSHSQFTPLHSSIDIDRQRRWGGIDVKDEYKGELDSIGFRKFVPQFTSSEEEPNTTTVESGEEGETEKERRGLDELDELFEKSCNVLQKHFHISDISPDSSLDIDGMGTPKSIYSFVDWKKMKTVDHTEKVDLKKRRYNFLPLVTKERTALSKQLRTFTSLMNIESMSTQQ